MSQFENLVIFVSDALRYEYFPEELRNGKEVIPTLAPSLHTPTSFTSLHTARSPENHNVSGFMEKLDKDIETSFDFFPDTSFYDGGGVSSVKKYVFDQEEVRDLEDMETPFIWIERMLDTHAPYGHFSHEGAPDEDIKGSEYLDRARKGEFDIKKDYEKGVENMKNHVRKKIEYLEDQGLLENTLVIITSDHGDALGERFLGERRYGHNYPMMKEIAQVPTVFYNYDVDNKAMRTIDIIPTAFGIMGKNFEIGDGVDVRKKSVGKGKNIMKDSKANYSTQWEFKDGQWQLDNRSKVERILKTVSGDIKKRLYHYGGKHILEKLGEDEEDKENEIEGIEV